MTSDVGHVLALADRAMIVPGLRSLVRSDGFAETTNRLALAMQEHKITPMLRLDHSALASVAGIPLAPLLLVVFGDPRIGTALMQENPTAGIDLPLKLLVWECEGGIVRIGYNDPEWLGQRHHLRDETHALARITAFLGELASAAAGCGRATPPAIGEPLSLA